MNTSPLRLRPVRWSKLPASPDGESVGLCIADSDDAHCAPVLQAFTQSVAISGARYQTDLQTVRRELARWYARQWDWAVPEHWILPMPHGAKSSLRVLAQALRARRPQAMVTTPVYSGIRKVVAAAYPELREVALEGTPERRRLPLDTIGAVTRSGPATVVLCNPHNPLGRVWDRDELAELAQVAHATGAFVVSDEVHADLVHPGHSHTTWGRVDARTDFAVVHSFGKAFNVSGLGTSVIITPDADLRDSVISELSSWGLHPGGLVTEMLALAVVRYGDDWLEGRRHRVQQRVRSLCEVLTAATPAVPVAQVRAGFLVWADIGEPRTGENAAEWLARTAGVRALDGQRFGEEQKGWVRLNAATDEELLRQAVFRILRVRAEAIRAGEVVVRGC